MQPSDRVCPFCGEPPGAGVFCAACGRNLTEVERLPTRDEWQRERAASAPSRVVADDVAPTPERCAEATAAFLEAMHDAGDPGTEETVLAGGVLRRRKLRGWVVRPVERDDEARPRRYEPGLVLAVEGGYHRLDSELRGFGQRDFPSYEITVSREPIEMPVHGALVGELAAVLRENGVVAGPPFTQG
jgi:hypothetical protein